MAGEAVAGNSPSTEGEKLAPNSISVNKSQPRWSRFFKKSQPPKVKQTPTTSSNEDDEGIPKPEKWSLGILNDKETDEVPGTILLMSKPFKHNEPLGLRYVHGRTSHSSLPSPYPLGLEPEHGDQSQSPGARPTISRPQSGRSHRPHAARVLSAHSVRSARSIEQEKKKTSDGEIILEPQPDDSLNDPLNWPAVRRDIALLSLGFYCALGGGMTPVLAAGFNNVSATYDVPLAEVALTTGFYMAGMGVGSVIASPTAILFGKRPVYIAGVILFILTAVWCALSPSFPSLVVARVIQGMAISPIECLPSATIAEIFFLHERAYRLGIYTLLLLGGKNLIPLISAAIIQTLGWRWVFWVVAIAAGFALFLLFFFVPETFWDRTPRPKKPRRNHLASLTHLFSPGHHHGKHSPDPVAAKAAADLNRIAREQAAPSTSGVAEGTIAQRRQKAVHHVGFVEPLEDLSSMSEDKHESDDALTRTEMPLTNPEPNLQDSTPKDVKGKSPQELQAENGGVEREEKPSKDSDLDNSPSKIDYFSKDPNDPEASAGGKESAVSGKNHVSGSGTPMGLTSGASTPNSASIHHTYTQHLRTRPPKTYRETLKPWNGRLRRDNWFKVAIRPFILFAYPSILWSTLVYSLSIGWLIVLSESISTIYRSPQTYNFTALQAGIVYLSPFVGGVLGTAVAGKVSDVLVRYLARRNGGIYEPEFRLLMAGPVLLATCIGLMGFGWSAEERDNFMVPTIFFGIISFGCSLGSTTAITFAVDSYRQYAGEALVTLNFSKNLFHGLVFSLFFPRWLEADGSKNVFLAIGGIQIACLLTTIPMYIYGKRARMWTVKKNMLERF